MLWLFAIVCGFSVGIFAYSVLNFGWSFAVFVLILALIFAGARAVFPRLAYTLCAACCVFIALGVARALLADAPLPDTFVSDLKERVQYDGVVVGDPDLRDATSRTPVVVEKDNATTKMLVVASRTQEAVVGDHVHVSGTLAVPEPFDTDGGRVFRYDKYLERDGIRFIMNFASMRVTEQAPWYSVSMMLARMKHAFLNGLTTALPEPYASLAGGIVIGGKSGLGAELKDAFARSGIIHIVVLSGYNIMVVAEWVMAAFGALRLRRRLSAVLGALAVVVLVGIAGFSAAAMRAMIMALIALYARATGKSYVAGRALLVTVFVMLIWNPLYLAFDPGFSLSVAATAGLIWLSPTIEKWLSVIVHDFWRDIVSTTFAAQVAVLPLLLYQTGNLSLVSLPANVLVAPVIPATMGFSALAGVVGMLFGGFAPVVSIVIGYPAYLTTSYLILVAEDAAALPAAAVTLPAFQFWIVLLAYAILGIFAYRVSRTDIIPE